MLAPCRLHLYHTGANFISFLYSVVSLPGLFNFYCGFSTDSIFKVVSLLLLIFARAEILAKLNYTIFVLSCQVIFFFVLKALILFDVHYAPFYFVCGNNV